MVLGVYVDMRPLSFVPALLSLSVLCIDTNITAQGTTITEPPLVSDHKRPVKVVKPVYPHAALKAGIGGVVNFAVAVGKNGQVEKRESDKRSNDSQKSGTGRGETMGVGTIPPKFESNPRQNTSRTQVRPSQQDHEAGIDSLDWRNILSHLSGLTAQNSNRMETTARKSEKRCLAVLDTSSSAP